MSAPGRLSPRMRRALVALQRRPHSRRELDQVAGALNSPHVVMELRELGVVIACERRPMRDRDGVMTRPGIYSLHPDSHDRARELLEGDVCPSD